MGTRWTAGGAEETPPPPIGGASPSADRPQRRGIGARSPDLGLGAAREQPLYMTTLV